MKNIYLVLTAAVVAVGALAGSSYMGRAKSDAASSQSEVRIGEQSPGPAIPATPPTWSPRRDRDGFTVNRDLPVRDSRVIGFADFPVLLPSYLPRGAKLSSATILWDPVSDKRTLQIAVQGRFNGIITEQRMRDRDENYPDGMLLRTEKQQNGNVYRNLLSNVDGVGVSMAWETNLSDEEIIKVFQSLRPEPRAKGSGGQARAKD